LTTISLKTKEIEYDIRDVIDFQDDRFEEIIRELGFVCDLCGRCCTREFNDHVFLLDDDAERMIEVAGRKVLRPAPYYEFCDNLGRFYVMGYALRNKSNGDCIFYTGGRCVHYADRPEICRIFPYMLHREEDDEGKFDWRQIGGLNMHGLYHSEVGVEEARKIAGDVKRYEIAFLKQKLAFLHKIEEHFKKHGLRHSKQIYDRKMRDLKRGGEIELYVFERGGFINANFSI
jgi:uncharacterized protein